MRILTRYILREVTSHALIGALIFTFVIFMRDLARILELVVRNSAPLPSVAQLFLFTISHRSYSRHCLWQFWSESSLDSAGWQPTAKSRPARDGHGFVTFLEIVSIFAVVAWLIALAKQSLFRSEIRPLL